MYKICLYSVYIKNLQWMKVIVVVVDLSTARDICLALETMFSHHSKVLRMFSHEL